MNMRKRMYLLCLSLLCGILCWGQNDSEKEFWKRANELDGKVMQCFEDKDYEAGIKYCREFIALYDRQSEQSQQTYREWKASFYYNIACFQSLQKKISPALKHFELACESGYSNYYNALTDSDLDNLRKQKRFQAAMQKLREAGDYLYILQQSEGYAKNGRTDTLPRFKYAYPNDSNLVRVRQYFKLDSVAGAGDEISKIKNILTYIHNKIRHDGQHDNPDEYNAISLAEACKDGSHGLNCRGLATVLNECYLAMGIKSRFVTCLPKVYINDCHVINAVYSCTLDKWLWMDPTQNAWVTDEAGNLLSIQEVRQRLHDDQPVLLNEEANWNNMGQTTAEDYLYRYMAKNQYALQVSDSFGFDTETFSKRKEPLQYILLLPQGFEESYPKYISNKYKVCDDA